MEIFDVAEARKAHENSLEREPTHPDSHINLGRLLHEERVLEAAEEHYRQALRTRPGDATALYNLGRLSSRS